MTIPSPRLGLPFDASSLPTGHYPYELTPFPTTRSPASAGRQSGLFWCAMNGKVQFGGGWTLSGLDRLIRKRNRSLVLARGTGRPPSLRGGAASTWAG